jgi:hypothetical protein
LRIKIVAAAENVNRDVCFLYGLTPSLQSFLNDIAKKCLPPAAAGKSLAFKQLVNVRENPEPLFLG